MQQIIYTGIGVLGCLSFIAGVITFLQKSKFIKFDIVAFVKKILYKEITDNMELIKRDVANLHESHKEIRYENEQREKEDLRFKILLYRKIQLSGMKLTDADRMNENALFDRYTALGGNSYIKDIHKEIKKN